MTSLKKTKTYKNKDYHKNYYQLNKDKYLKKNTYLLSKEQREKYNLQKRDNYQQNKTEIRKNRRGVNNKNKKRFLVLEIDNKTFLFNTKCDLLKLSKRITKDEINDNMIIVN